MRSLTFLIAFVCGLTLLEAGEFFEAKGTQYFISYPLRKNWFQAQRFCNYHGQHLISVHSFEEEQIISSLINQFKQKYNITKSIHIYTSGTDLGHFTNEFYWVTTGHPFVYTNWITNHPTGARSQPDLSYDCVILNYNYDLQWQNLNCTSDYYFMCQNRITVPEVNRSVDQC